MGLQGYTLFFFIFSQKHRLWVLVEAVLTSTQIYVLSRNLKNIRVFNQTFFQFFEVKFSIYLNRRVGNGKVRHSQAYPGNHYENKPIQIYWKIYQQNMKKKTKQKKTT